VPIFQVFNGPMQTTAAAVAVTTGTAIKTMLQLATPSTAYFEVIEAGISFDGSAAATPIKCELIETDVGATITQHVAADITKISHPGGPASLADISSTTKSGYTASAEGTITAVRNLLAPQFIAPTNQFIIQFPMSQESIVQASKFLRWRVTAPAAVNCLCYLKWRE
jgi:hypothetical protein